MVWGVSLVQKYLTPLNIFSLGRGGRRSFNISYDSTRLPVILEGNFNFQMSKPERVRNAGGVSWCLAYCSTFMGRRACVVRVSELKCWLNVLSAKSKFNIQ